MIAKKMYALMFTAFMLLTSLTMVSVPVQSQSPPTFYVDQPLGYIPAKPAGVRFWVDILVNASDLTYNGIDGIVGYGLLVQVDPTVLIPRRVSTSTAGYFLWEFADWEWLPYPTVLTSINETTGTVDITEQIMPTPSGGAATDGVLPAPYLLVSIEFESLTLYQNTTINLVSALYMDATGAWQTVDTIDGEYQGMEMIPVGAQLVGRKAWPEHHHFDRSKSGNPEVPDSHGTPGVQTLYAKVQNTGDLEITIRALWRIMKSGAVEPMIVSNEVLVEPGDIVYLQADAEPFVPADDGKWYVEASCEYYNPYSEVWAPGENTKTTSFNVVA
jgi:hypothetical protein